MSKSIKLSKETRDMMADAVVSAMFKERRKTIQDRNPILFEKAWRVILGPEVVEHIVKFPTLFALRSSISVDFGGRDAVQLCRHSDADVHIGRVPGVGVLSTSSGYVRASLLDETLREAIRAWNEDKEACEIEIAELKKELKHFLYGFNTTGQLLAAWPTFFEDCPQAQKYVEPITQSLPALRDASEIKAKLTQAKNRLG